MKLISLTWEKFQVATPRAADARRSWPSRAGLRVLLEDTSGRIGQGEASPLPGYSPDDLMAAERALADVSVRDLSSDLEDVDSQLATVSSPSARFALETALLDVIGQQRQTALGLLLGLSPPQPQPVARLLTTREPDDVYAEVCREVRAGYRTFKVKVGAPGQFPSDIARLRAAREALPAGGRLRADANRGYGDDRLSSRLRGLVPLELEWIEEPASSRRLVGEESLPLPVALDESLADEREALATESLCAQGSVAALVLKPAVLGGLHAAARLAKQAAGFGVPCVVSHLFDGPIAYRAYAALACALGGEGDCPAHGLGPHPGLAPWPGVQVPIKEGWIHPCSAPGLGLPMLELTAGGSD